MTTIAFDVVCVIAYGKRFAWWVAMVYILRIIKGGGFFGRYEWTVLFVNEYESFRLYTIQNKISLFCCNDWCKIIKNQKL